MRCWLFPVFVLRVFFSLPFSTPPEAVVLRLTSTDYIRWVICVWLLDVGRSLEEKEGSDNYSLHSSPAPGVSGWWCSFVAAAIFFPALVSSGLGVVMDFHCCWVLGASASFVCSLNPAHASILSVLVHVCLVKFLPMCHLLPARS